MRSAAAAMLGTPLATKQTGPEGLPVEKVYAAFIEEDLSVDEIAARGEERVTVGRVPDMLKRNEHTRRQTPPGVRVSRRAFGRDWRYPVTNGYRR